MELIQNRVFDEIRIGDSASIVRTLSADDIVMFAAVSGDVNPTHVDEEFARSEMFHKVIAHGMWGASLISTVLGTELPGPGAIYLSQSIRFRKPVAVGDVIRVSVIATEKDPETRCIKFDCQCVNQHGKTVIDGFAEVIAPKEKVKRARVALPEVRVVDHLARYRQLMRLVKGIPPVRAAVVHPVDPLTLEGCLEAARSGLIIPTFIGPEQRILAVAATIGCDASQLAIESTEHSHAAAALGVAMARAGKVDILIKGTLANAEFLAAVNAPGIGIQTSRRLSHCSVLDVPTYRRPLILTDAELHPQPDLEDKRDIVQNAIRLAQATGIETPKVAILSASSRLDARLESTLHAAALCKMADRGQITGGILEGPMSFDTAVSQDAARRQGVSSPVAGEADVLVVPDLEVGRMLLQQLENLAGANAADLVLGARVPIVFPHAEDAVRSREAACALALLLVQQSKGIVPKGSAGGLTGPLADTTAPPRDRLRTSSARGVTPARAPL